MSNSMLLDSIVVVFKRKEILLHFIQLPEEFSPDGISFFVIIINKNSYINDSGSISDHQ
jgi:hypothetical protein